MDSARITHPDYSLKGLYLYLGAGCQLASIGLASVIARQFSGSLRRMGTTPLLA